jgi:hypothetical protein
MGFIGKNHMALFPKIRLLLLAFLLIPGIKYAQSQIWVTGKVYDSTRMVAIPFVKVTSTKGVITFTDSIGRYGMTVDKKDSINFTYRGKSTNYFPVKDIRYPAGFDISLQITVQDRYQTLKEVVVIGKSYKQDSLENREKYQRVFEFEGGGLQITSQGNLDPISLINAFKFRRNKSMRSFRNRLIEEEQEKFVRSRFTKPLVKQITGLGERDLDRFMLLWRPPYELVAFAEEYEFHQYILDASRYFKRGILPKRNTTPEIRN